MNIHEFKYREVAGEGDEVVTAYVVTRSDLDSAVPIFREAVPKAGIESIRRIK